MKDKKFAVAVTALLVSAAGLSLAGCGTESESQSDQTAAQSGITSGVAGPITVTPEELEGATFTLTHEEYLVIDVPSNPAGWVGEVDQIDVAQFLPGEKVQPQSADTRINPGFEGVAPGTTRASVTSPLGQTYEFTLVVQ